MGMMYDRAERPELKVSRIYMMNGNCQLSVISPPTKCQKQYNLNNFERKSTTGHPLAFKVTKAYVIKFMERPFISILISSCFINLFLIWAKKIINKKKKNIRHGFKRFSMFFYNIFHIIDNTQQ